MSSINKDDDILKFVLKKCQEPDIDGKNKVIYLFLKYYINALCKTYNSTKNIMYATECADLTTHIFNIIYNYTQHIRVSIFMMERTIFLFNSCINITNSTEMDIPFIKTSIIHKTIGSININNKLHNKKDSTAISVYFDIHAIHIIALFLKDIFIKLSKIIYNNSNLQNSLISSINSQDLIPSLDTITQDHDNINSEQEPLQYHLEYTMLLLHSILYRIIIEGFENWLELVLDNFIDNDLEDIYDYPKLVNIIRIRLELFLYSQKLYNDFIKAKHISTSIIDEYIEILENDDNLNEYMDYTQSIRNHIHFKILKDKLIAINM
jgi:hypothetical protein